MKLIRKTLILIIFLVISVTSMVTGVFAWFTGDKYAKIEPVTAQVMTDLVLDISIDQSEIFLGDRVRDLVYITDEDFNTVGFDFYGYASLLAVNIQNSTETDMAARVGLSAQAAPEFGNFAGVNGAFKFLVVANPSDVLPVMWTLQQSPNLFAAMSQYNGIGVTIPAMQTATVYVYIWGYYDGLPLEQKDIYHAIIYRMRMTLFS